MERVIFEVHTLNQKIKSLIESDFSLCGICVKGEVTSLNKHYTGHYYFKLRDEDGSLLSCTMFSSYTRYAPSDLKNGDHVILHKILLDNLDKVFAYVLSFLFVLILAVIFFFLSKEVKKGKFIPLIVTTSIYGLDAFSLFFTKGLYTTDWDYIVAIIVHVLVLGYLFYLIYLYNKIVNLSNENNKK